MSKFADPLLAIETSGITGEVALALGGAIVDERRLSGLRRNAAELVPAIEEMLAAHAMRVRDLAVVAFSGGPGSFTGVRVAATVARMLHSVVRARVVRVSTLEAIAESALALDGQSPSPRDQQSPNAELSRQPAADSRIQSGAAVRQQPQRDVSHILPMLDAKRGQIYAAAYAVEMDGMLREKVAARVIDPRVMLAEIFAIAPPTQWLALGAGVAACREVLDLAGVSVADDPVGAPSAGSVARCGLRMAATGQFANVAEMLPIYLRPPECEEVYDARRKAAMERRGEGPLSGARA